MIIKHYLTEIKNRICLILLFYVIFFICLYYYKNILLKLTILLNNKLYANYFIFTSVTELFSIYIDLIFLICNLILYFQISYHLISFLVNGLYLNEYWCIKLFFIYSTLFGILNFIVCQIILLPVLIEFFLSYQLNNNFYFEAKIYEYLKFYKKVYGNSFIQFQLIAILFTALDIMKNHFNENFFTKNRKNIYFTCLLIATMITPPDILSQILVCFFLINIFEIFIFLIILKKFHLTWQIIKTD